MPLNATTLKSSFLSKLNSLSFDETSDEADVKNAYAEMMADWVIEAITSATVTVPGTGLVAPPSGGPVTGLSNTGNLS
jgi:hypothetical protein